MQALAQSRRSHPMSLAGEGLDQLGHTFRRPSHQTHRVAFGIKMSFQIGL